MKAKSYKQGLLKRLADQEYARMYLTEVLENESQNAFLIALRNVIDAREENLSSLAEEIGLSRQALYKILSGRGNPTLESLNAVLKALGMRLSIAGNIAA